MVGQVFGLVRKFNIRIFLDTMNVIMSIFAWWYYTLSCTCSLHFQWPWHYFKVTKVSNSFYWNWYVLIRLRWNFEELLSTLTFAYIQGRLLAWFLIWQKPYRWLFHGHCSSEFFQTWNYYNFAWLYGLTTLTLFQGQRYVRIINCKLFLDSWPPYFKGCMVLTGSYTH